jgi:hypothetical protein
MEYCMDGSRFDHLARQWASRRSAISGLLGGLLLPLLPDDEADARKKGQHTDHHKRRGKSHRRDKTAKHKGHHAGNLNAEKKKKHKKKCKGGTLKCGKVCVTASTDASNCGACGNACGSGQACVGGVCQSPPSTGTCPTGQIRCGGGCVDPKSDESHCGGCGNACQGNLTCLSGTCGCADASDTQCGTLCVDTRDDDDHCGGCGTSCSASQTCVGGQCQASGGCSAGQVTCAGQCVDTQTDARHCGACGRTCSAGQRCQAGQCVDQPECVDQYGCGGYDYNDLKCVNGRCVCADPTEGICQRYPDRRGRCHVCCPGGNGQCLRDEVCHLSGEPGNYFAVCNCPTGWDRCTYNYPTGTCTPDWDRDPRKCGQFCNDCQYNLEQNPKGVCCNGGCTTGCAPGFRGSGCHPGDPCGPNCLPCGEGSICCNMGPGTEPRCIPNVTGYCYIN